MSAAVLRLVVSFVVVCQRWIKTHFSQDEGRYGVLDMTFSMLPKEQSSSVSMAFW